MKEAYYTTEGIKYDTLEEAHTIAKRFHKRYGKRKDIDVVLVSFDVDGSRHEEVVTTILATKPALVECPDTIDMFG